MFDWILILAFTYIILKEIRNFLNKRIYVKVEVNNSINKNGDIYINLYDYKKKNEILPRAIVRTSDLEEFKLNKNLVTSINYKEKMKYKYLNFW